MLVFKFVFLAASLLFSCCVYGQVAPITFESYYYANIDYWDDYRIEAERLNGQIFKNRICPKSQITCKEYKSKKNHTTYFYWLDSYTFQDSYPFTATYIEGKSLADKTPTTTSDTFIYNKNKQLEYQIYTWHHSKEQNLKPDTRIVFHHEYDSNTTQCSKSTIHYFQLDTITASYKLGNIQTYLYFYHSNKQIQKYLLYNTNSNHIDSVLYDYKKNTLVLTICTCRFDEQCQQKVHIQYIKGTQKVFRKTIYNSKNQLNMKQLYCYGKDSLVQKIKLLYISKSNYSYTDYAHIHSWHFTWDDKGRIASRIVKNRWGKCLEKTTYEYVD